MNNQAKKAKEETDRVYADVKKEHARYVANEKIKDEKLQKQIEEAGKKAILNDPATYGFKPNMELKPVQLNKDIYFHLLSDESKKIYQRRVQNTVVEVNEHILFVKEENVIIRTSNLVQYFQVLVKYEDIDYDFNKDVRNMAKCFNYLVENGFVDFGILYPISRLPLARTSKMRREILFMFITPSKYLTLKANQLCKQEKISFRQALNEITKLPYWCDEGQTPKTTDWQPLYDLLGKEDEVDQMKQLFQHIENFPAANHVKSLYVNEIENKNE